MTSKRGSGPQARTILVVDDNRTTLNVLGHQLGKLGYLPVLSDSAIRALDLIGAGGFDLVLLDYDMPKMSGIEVLRHVRAAHETTDLPVIMMTGHDDAAAPVGALEAGANDYVARPFAFDVLAARVARTLRDAKQLEELKRFNATLDARIASRAIELGETRVELANLRHDRKRLVRSIDSLTAQVARLGG
ncbi:response regulator [Stakelama sp. CBK3Z-3]|uniref:Response regulator n=2 Tax=Stakelama flava TaxID=2860338 RepID=A0ABS6XP34_9SPHN|nr:response regulator [Stakelama flava]